MQLKIHEMYENNVSIENWVANSEFFDEKSEKVSLNDIKFHDQFYGWLESFCVQEMYKDERYPGFKIPEYRMNAVPLNNVLISPVRLT
jgi:hypothetical protein